MPDVVVVALIVAASSAFTVILTNRQRQAAQREDWNREDALAAQAVRIAEEAAETAKRNMAANERVAAQSQVTVRKLDEIHKLVNSNLTEAIRAQLTATEGQLVAMLRPLSDPPTSTEIRSVEQVISDLKDSLQKRDAQTEASEK